MLETEYIRNCNCNYERIRLEQRPEERRYQYCILNRGGIRYLLPGSLRYINDEAYLYYDISSTQNIKQVFEVKKIGRDWFGDFLWGIRKMLEELDRFLLEEQSIIWSPKHVFQDLEKNDFSFLYIPYYKEDTGLMELMDFLLERIDYEDVELVSFIYTVYEQIEAAGLEYLKKHIHEAWENFGRKRKEERESSVEVKMVSEVVPAEEYKNDLSAVSEKRSVPFWKENRRKKIQQREDYREKMRQKIFGSRAMAVCEETIYEDKVVQSICEREEKERALECEEYGKTIYIEDVPNGEEPGLYKPDGELVMKMDVFPFIIGKRKEDVQFAINDYSVSRVHARITVEEGIYYIEDLNSTNGTFKNGLRLQPYEKRKLEREDEVKFGKSEYIYR